MKSNSVRDSIILIYNSTRGAMSKNEKLKSTERNSKGTVFFEWILSDKNILTFDNYCIIYPINVLSLTTF